MSIVFDKLFELMQKKGVSMYQLRKEKVIGTATYVKLNKMKVPQTVAHVDTRTIDALCERLHCQPRDIMRCVHADSQADAVPGDEPGCLEKEKS